MQNSSFHQNLYTKTDEYVHCVYSLTKKFPKEELFGSASQLRRSSLSVMLNYIEGYARMRDKVHKNFLEIAYGSLKESKYLLNFAMKEGYINNREYEKANNMAEEVGAMLWGILRKL